MRRDLAKSLALPGRLHDQRNVALSEVTQTAMDEFRGAARSSGSKVASFDETDAKPAHGTIASDARPSDPASDHQEVQRLRRQIPEVILARFDRKAQ